MKGIFCTILCAALLAGLSSCQPIVPAESSQASSAPSSLESTETGSFSTEELEAAQIREKKIMDCFACHGLTDDARRTGQITDREIWQFVLGTYYYRDDPDFPYETWPEVSDDGTTAYFPMDSLQQMVEEIFGVSQWTPDFVWEECEGQKLAMPTEMGLNSAYGYEDLKTEALSQDTAAVSMQLVDSPSFPGGQNYGEYQFVFSLCRDEDDFFLRLKEFHQTSAPQPQAAASGEPFTGQLTAEEQEKWAYQAEQTAGCLASYVLSEGMKQTGQVEDLDIWAFLLASILYRDELSYPVWPETSPDGQSAYFPEEDIQTTVAQLFGISGWRPEFMKESMLPETNRLEMRLAETFHPYYACRNTETRLETGNRFAVSMELTDASGGESQGQYSFAFTLFQDGASRFLRLAEFGPAI